MRSENRGCVLHEDCMPVDSLDHYYVPRDAQIGLTDSNTTYDVRRDTSATENLPMTKNIKPLKIQRTTYFQTQGATYDILRLRIRRKTSEYNVRRTTHFHVVGILYCLAHIRNSLIKSLVKTLARTGYFFRPTYLGKTPGGRVERVLPYL